jgi:hypothetical protein
LWSNGDYKTTLHMVVHSFGWMYKGVSCGHDTSLLFCFFPSLLKREVHSYYSIQKRGTAKGYIVRIFV